MARLLRFDAVSFSYPGMTRPLLEGLDGLVHGHWRLEADAADPVVQMRVTPWGTA